MMSSAAVMIGALRVKPGCQEEHYAGLCNIYYVLVWGLLISTEISCEGYVKVNGCTPYFLSFSQNETTVDFLFASLEEALPTLHLLLIRCPRDYI